MTVRKTTIAGVEVTAPKLTQRRAMVLSRHIARAFGPLALDTAGALVAALVPLEDADASDMETLIALSTALRENMPPEQVEQVIDRLVSDQVWGCVLSILDGAIVGGVQIDRKDEATIDEAWTTPDPWAPYMVAWWIAGEYRLFPWPGGSGSDKPKPNASGNAEAPEASPAG